MAERLMLLLILVHAVGCGAGPQLGFANAPSLFLWNRVRLGEVQGCSFPSSSKASTAKVPLGGGCCLKAKAEHQESKVYSTDELEERIGVKFTDSSLLKKACTHRSIVEGIDSNERLEFLGDAVLGMIVAEQLFRENEGFREGRLSDLRKEVVSRKALARVGRDQGLGAFLLISTAEESTGGRNKENALADMVESIIAAVYIDQGLEEARGLIARWLGGMMSEAAASPEGSDYKTRLQEEMRRLHLGAPCYSVVRSGPVHNSRFIAHMASEQGQRLGWGEGKSKKEAEQAAAEYSLQLLGRMSCAEMGMFRGKEGGGSPQEVGPPQLP